jgi:hypothetical protein
MHHVIRSFFYSVALLTMYWITQTSAEAITFAAWVRVVQTLEAQQVAAMLTLVVAFGEVAVGAVLGAPKMVTQVVGFRQSAPPQR